MVAASAAVASSGVPIVGLTLSPDRLLEIRRNRLRLLNEDRGSTYVDTDAVRDEVVKAGLGPIASEFLRLKRGEWQEYHRQISPWEIERFLTML